MRAIATQTHGMSQPKRLFVVLGHGPFSCTFQRETVSKYMDCQRLPFVEKLSTPQIVSPDKHRRAYSFKRGD